MTGTQAMTAAKASMATRARPVVFIVDDDESVRRALARAVRWAGHDAETFASGEEFLASGRLNAPGCLILDLCMPGMSGLKVQARLVGLGSTIPVIFISAHDLDLELAQAQEVGAVAYLRKPFNEAELMDAVHTALGTAE